MAGKYDDLAKTIVENVGGKENVNSLAHCVTRLRFKLKDEDKANTDILKGTKGVITVMQAGGQYQVVVGPQVAEIYDAILALGGIQAGGSVDADPGQDDEAEGPKGPVDVLMDLISSIIQPTLGCLAAAGMIKGLLALLTFLGIMTANDGAYKVMYSVGDGFFYFLPIVLGITAARKFKMSEFIGASLGMALTYPSMVNIASATVSSGAIVTPEILGTVFEGTPFAMSYYTTFFGLPVIMPSSGYTSTVVPIILIVWVTSLIYKPLKEKVPASVNFFMVPFICMLFGTVAGYLVVGPIASILTNVVMALFNGILAIPVIGSALCGLILGSVWQILVMFGLHWALVPLALNNYATLFYDGVLSGQFGCTFGQIAVCFAIYLKATDETTKEVALPSIITGFFGTTEPAIYGVTLPRMKPFVISCIAGGVSGLWMGITNVKSFVSGYSGFMGIASYIDVRTADQLAGAANEGITNVINVCIGVVIAMVVGFVLTWFFWDEKKYEQEQAA